MRPNNDGTFEADPGEQIRFTVKRTNPPCNASFSSAGWSNCGPVTEPDTSTKTQACTAPTAVCSQCSMTITVSFIPSGGVGDQYTVTITGGNGGSATDTFSPPPNVNGQKYKFHVSNP